MKKNLFIAVLIYCTFGAPRAYSQVKPDSTRKDVVTSLIKIVMTPKVQKSEVSDSTWTKLSNDIFVLTDGINKLSADSLISFYEAIHMLKPTGTYVTEQEVSVVVLNAMHSAVQAAVTAHKGDVKKRLIASFARCTAGAFEWTDPVVTEQEDDRPSRRRRKKD